MLLVVVGWQVFYLKQTPHFFSIEVQVMDHTRQLKTLVVTNHKSNIRVGRRAGSRRWLARVGRWWCLLDPAACSPAGCVCVACLSDRPRPLRAAGSAGARVEVHAAGPVRPDGEGLRDQV